MGKERRFVHPLKSNEVSLERHAREGGRERRFVHPLRLREVSSVRPVDKEGKREKC